MASREATEAVRTLMEGLSNEHVRALGLQALKRWRAEKPDASLISMHGDLGRHLAALLGERKATAVDTHSCKEPFVSEHQQDYMAPFAEFIWWLVRAGIVIPLLIQDGGAPTMLRLTAAGARLLDTVEDHPLTSGFMERLARRCPGIPDDVIEHVQDAESCLEHGLGRPAVVLMGLAYERAVQKVGSRLGAAGRLDAAKFSEARAARCIDMLKGALPALKLDDETKYRISDALDFAHQLRRRRNDGSHTKPTFPFDDSAEIQELLVSAGRHLPGLWRLCT